MKCKDWPIGICSWSLQTDIDGVADAMKKIGIEHVHLGIRAAVGDDDYLAAVQNQNWIVSSTMIDFPQEDYSTIDSIKVTGGIAPDDCWEQNKQLFMGAVDATVKLGVKYISTHAGFIDESDPEYIKKFYDRITTLADAAAEKDLMLLLETGQETAEELKHFLEELDHSAIGVNFDPANMILYDKGNPIEAVTVLAPWIKHIHIKDATQTEQPGTWGAEVPWGDGQVGTETFLSTLGEIGFNGVIAIEREAGNDRFGDIKLAAERLLEFNT
jgi:sugar phosphate isomerase/epimerase